MVCSWDVFCRVVDNYGDAAVCWRLARELAARGSDMGRSSGGRVRLWLDDLAALHALAPDIDPQRARQQVAGAGELEVLRWPAGAEFRLADGDAPADIVVEGFGCGLPDAYVEAMARRRPAPLWITLEYLSAEPRVAQHHGLPSPHPRLPLARYFFFPGFTPETGGLLKEADLDARRDAFAADPMAKSGFWRRHGFAPPAEGVLCVSLFGYENPAVTGLLEAWATGTRPIVAAVPPGRLRPQVAAFFGGGAAAGGHRLKRGQLEARFLPFLPQSDYEELLWACDWNFVRGEDSFVRAQWAARPLVWHIYPQAERAHWAKLGAFLDRWCVGLAPSAAAAVRRLSRAWNGMEEGAPAPACARAWEAVLLHHDELSRHARAWAKELDYAGNLAEKLAQFCADRLNSPAS